MARQWNPPCTSDFQFIISTKINYIPVIALRVHWYSVIVDDMESIFTLCAVAADHYLFPTNCKYDELWLFINNGIECMSYQRL